MKVVNRYCESVRKKTERVLKKMFGYTVKEAVFERAHLQVALQCLIGKRIEIFDFLDIF